MKIWSVTKDATEANQGLVNSFNYIVAKHRYFDKGSVIVKAEGTDTKCARYLR